MFAMKVTAPSSYTVISNGERVSSTSVASGMREWQYEALTPMPTYDVHVVAYDSYVETRATAPASRVPVSTYVYARDVAAGRTMFGEATAALDYFAQTFGDYRWGSLSYQEEPIFGGGMEHAGCVSMDETLFSMPTSSRTTTFHELAHHWSGNLVRVRTWNDFWLSEGFADYLTGRAVTAIDGDAAGKAFWKKTLASALAADASAGHALRPADPEIDVLEIFDEVSYAKGAVVLRMLEHEIGEPAFTNALKTWFDEHAFAAQTTKDFEGAIAALPAARAVDVAGFFRTFVYGEGHPNLRVTHAPDGAGTTIRVEQTQAGDPFVFTLDVEVKHGTTATLVRVPVSSRVTEHRLDVAVDGLEADPSRYVVGTVR